MREEELQRLPDDQIFRKAVAENRVVLTLDLELGEIVASLGTTECARGTFPATEVLSAIRRVLAGEIYLSEKMTSFFLKSLSAGGARSFAQPLERLIDRELQVLEFIGRGYTTRAIAEALKLGIATVDTYRDRIKQKMDFRNAIELQHFAIRWARDQE